MKTNMTYMLYRCIEPVCDFVGSRKKLAETKTRYRDDVEFTSKKE